MDFKKQVLGKSVQFKELDGEMWVVANDIGRVLGISKIRDTIRSFVSEENARVETVKYLTGSKQRYQAILLNVDGLIEIMTNTDKGTQEEKRNINNIVVATMLTMNDEINDPLEDTETLLELKADELEKLNSYILLEHIYDLRGQLQEKDDIIKDYQNKIEQIKELVDEYEA